MIRNNRLTEYIIMKIEEMLFVMTKQHLNSLTLNVSGGTKNCSYKIYYLIYSTGFSDKAVLNYFNYCIGNKFTIEDSCGLIPEYYFIITQLI